MASTPRERLEQRLGALKTERSSWLTHWAEISEFILPRRGKYLGRQAKSRGAKSNSRIRNSTATYAIRTSTAGMNSGLTNPSSRWFRMSPADDDLAEAEGVRQWCDQVEAVLYKVLAASAAYQQLNSVYEELLAFGTSAVWHDEDRENVCRFQTLTAGEYMLATGEAGKAAVCYRELEMTVAQVVERFGLERCTQGTRNAFDRGNYENVVEVYHALEPISRRVEGLQGAGRWPYVSVWWEKAAPRDGGFLKVSGYNECPLHAPRWDIVAGDVYGRSPAMDVLPDVKQLQDTELSKWQASQILGGRGPMQGPELTGGAPDLSMGAYVPTVRGKDLKIEPVFSVPPAAVQLLGEDVRRLEERIRAGLYADLFLMFSMDDRAQRATAREIDARDAEKLLMLGPMVLRANSELLDPMIDRIYAILERASVPRWRAGMPAPLPPPPEALAGQELKVQYVSLLQSALQQVKVRTIEGVLQVAMPLAQVDPSVIDKLDVDQILDEVAGAYGSPAGIIRSDDAVAEIRANRQQAQAAQQQMMMLGEAAKAAQPAANAAATIAGMEQGNVPPAA